MVVSKSRHTRLPELPFRSFVRDDVILPEEPHKNSGRGGGGAAAAMSNLKRDTLSLDEAAGSGGSNSRRFQVTSGSTPEALRSRSVDGRQADGGGGGGGGGRGGAGGGGGVLRPPPPPSISWSSSQDGSVGGVGSVEDVRWTPQGRRQGTLFRNSRSAKVSN